VIACRESPVDFKNCLNRGQGPTQIDSGAFNMKIRPLDDRLVVKQAEAESKTASGIYLPEGAKEKPTRGKVISVGPGKMLDSGTRSPITVSVGDEVYYGKYAGTEVKVNDEKFVILRESDLLGVVEK
jgi:chaperonin GroES